MPYPGPYHGKPWEDRVTDDQGNVVAESTTPELAAAYNWWDESIAAAWAVAEGAGIQWLDTITAPTALVLGRGYPVNAASGAIALTLPTPVPGRQVAVQLVSSSSPTNVATVAAGVGASIIGGTRTLKLRGTVEVLQAASTSLWVVRSSGIPVASLEDWFATDTELAGKAALSHTHTITQVTGLRSELDALTLAAGSAPPVFFARQTVGQSGGNSSSWINRVTFTTEEIDTHNAHSTSTNPSRFTVPAGWAGIYECSGLALVSTPSSPGASIMKNGAYVSGSQAASPGTGPGWAHTATVEVVCDPGDYLELGYRGENTYTQDDGAGQNCSSFRVRWVRPKP